MRIGIIGTGAIGGYYGANLQRAGYDVHFVLRSDFEHVKVHGLDVRSVHGDFKLPNVQAHNAVSDLPPCDFLLLSLKTFHLDAVINDLSSALSENGKVVVAFNGIGFDERVAEVVGANHIIAAAFYIGATKTGPGKIDHFGGRGAAGFAPFTPNQPNDDTSDFAELEDALTAANISTEHFNDHRMLRWRKLMWNIPFAGLNIALNATCGEILRFKPTHTLAHNLIKEVQLTAAAQDLEIPDEFTIEMLKVTEERIPDYLASTKLDFDAGGPTEIEAIFGAPLKAAQQLGVETPLLEMLYQQLCYAEQARAS